MIKRLNTSVLITFVLFTLLSLHSAPLFAAKQVEEMSPLQRLLTEEEYAPGYTVNFSDVSILEVLKFIGRISKTNFIYNEGELNFNVTIISEEATPLSNLTTALIQVLRINGFTLLEDGNNLIVHKADDVKQIPTVISRESPLKGKYIPPMITRLFRVEKGNPDSIAKILKPMMSAEAIIEVSNETRHLIVTDAVTNVAQVATLLLTLDSTDTALSIGNFVVKNNEAALLVSLVDQIITPISEGNPFIVVPQQNTNTLFVVSTPFLIDKTLEVLEELDEPPKLVQSLAAFTSENVFLYNVKNKPAEIIEQTLEEMAQTLEKTQNVPIDFLATIHSMRYIEASHSLLFVGDEQSIAKIKEMLAKIDVKGKFSPEGYDSSFFMYKPQYLSLDEIVNALDEIKDNLKRSKKPDKELIDTIRNMKIVESTDTILFTGDQDSIEEIKQLLSAIDTADSPALKHVGKAHDFYLYNPKYQTGEEILSKIHEIVSNLQRSKLADPKFLITLENVKWIPSSNSLLFIGDANSIQRAQELLGTIDVPKPGGPETTTLYVFKLKNVKGNVILGDLQNMVHNLRSSGLHSPNLIQTIENIKWIESTNSLMITGDHSSVEQVKTIIAEFDTPHIAEPGIEKIGKTTYFIYKLRYVSGTQLMSSLRSIMGDLKKTGTPDQSLVNSISSMRFIPKTNSIIFTGAPETLEKVKALAERFDLPELAVSEGPRLAPEGYIIYHPKFQSGEDLINVMHDFEQNLVSSGVEDRSLFDTINNLKWMEKTQSILISGDQASTEKVKMLLEKFDVPGEAGEDEPSIETIDDMSFLIYKLEYHRGTEIETALKQVAQDLRDSKSAEGNIGLIDAINSIQWIEVTNSLIGTGKSQTLSKLKELIRNIDVPLRQVFIEVLVIETDIQNTLDFGLRWGSQGKYRDKFGYATGLFPQNDPLPDFETNLSDITATRTPTGSDVPFSTGFDMGIIGDIILHRNKSYFALGSLINALQFDSDTTIILNQKLIAQDNKNSKLFVGSNLPFTGSIVSTQGLTQQTSANLEYRDIGVSLNITPQIGNTGMVTILVDEEISEVATDAQGNPVSNSTVTGIATTKTTTQTQVTMPDRHFLVLSGMIRNTKLRTRSGIPCLGGLPFIGAAFSENNSLTQSRNVIIFLRPQVINSFEEYNEITENQEDLYRSLGVPEDFDEGLEFVKSPDDA